MYPSRKNREQGFALVTAIILLIGCLGLSLSFFSVSVTAVGHADSQADDLRMEATATAAASLITQRFWDGFLAQTGGDSGSLQQFRDYLGSGNAPISVAAGPDEGLFGTYQDASALVGALDDSSLGHLDVAQAMVRRRDTPTSTDFEVDVTIATGAGANAETRSVRQLVSVAGETFNGFEYALLTTNVNCIMCHASFDNAHRYYNTDSNLYGSFDRVKVGTLESMMIRPTSAHSAVSGTIHSRGILMDNHGNPLPGLEGSSLVGVEHSTANGKLVQDYDGDLIEDDLTLAEGDPLPKNGQLYLNYPTNKSEMTDGILPTEFPSAIPDLNGNRLVDPAEFQAVASSASGTLKNGTIYSVPEGSSYAGGLPGSGNTTQIDGTTGNNVILIGTDDNPIELSGTVMVDGDIVIYGKVKGDGALFASGNIYMVGSTTYADGVDADGYRTYGVAEDGSTNALGLAAGGNIIIGDPSQKGAADGTINGAYNFTMNEIAIFNRNEWSKTQETLPGLNGEVQNPLYDPNYEPRYYVYEEGQPAYIFNGDDLPPEVRYALYFDPATATWKGVEAVTDWYDLVLDAVIPGTDAYANAAITPLYRADDWISKETLLDFFLSAEAANDGSPFQIDSLLYTNNSAWAMVKGNTGYNGRVEMNGSLVAYDTGILSPNGLQLNFDDRLGSRVNLTSLETPVEMRRVYWARLSAAQKAQP